MKIGDYQRYENCEFVTRTLTYFLPFQFVQTLEEWLQSLERHPQGPTKDVLIEYKAKVDFLKKILESRSQPNKVKSNNDVVDVAGGTRRRSLRSLSPPTVSEIIGGASTMPMIPHGPTTTGQALTSEIHHKTVENHNEQLRAALFGQGDQSEVRRRNVANEENQDLDYLLKAHHQAQEQIAEEMLSLTKTLKEQSMAAKEVIQKDTNVIEKANEVVDKNSERLKKETERIQEHTKFSCRCWVWLLLAVVTMTFIAMVWVMKLFRKRSDY